MSIKLTNKEASTGECLYSLELNPVKLIFY